MDALITPSARGAGLEVARPPRIAD
jgi:hypothetical protein